MEETTTPQYVPVQNKILEASSLVEKTSFDDPAERVASFDQQTNPGATFTSAAAVQDHYNQFDLSKAENYQQRHEYVQAMNYFGKQATLSNVDSLGKVQSDYAGVDFNLPEQAHLYGEAQKRLNVLGYNVELDRIGNEKTFAEAYTNNPNWNFKNASASQYALYRDRKAALEAKQGGGEKVWDATKAGAGFIGTLLADAAYSSFGMGDHYINSTKAGLYEGTLGVGFNVWQTASAWLQRLDVKQSADMLGLTADQIKSAGYEIDHQRDTNQEIFQDAMEWWKQDMGGVDPKINNVVSFLAPLVLTGGSGLLAKGAMAFGAPEMMIGKGLLLDSTHLAKTVALSEMQLGRAGVKVVADQLAEATGKMRFLEESARKMAGGKVSDSVAEMMTSARNHVAHLSETLRTAQVEQDLFERSTLLMAKNRSYFGNLGVRLEQASYKTLEDGQVVPGELTGVASKIRNILANPAKEAELIPKLQAEYAEQLTKLAEHANGGKIANAIIEEGKQGIIGKAVTIGDYVVNRGSMSHIASYMALKSIINATGVGHTYLIASLAKSGFAWAAKVVKGQGLKAAKGAAVESSQASAQIALESALKGINVAKSGYLAAGANMARGAITGAAVGNLFDAITPDDKTLNQHTGMGVGLLFGMAGGLAGYKAGLKNGRIEISPLDGEHSMPSLTGMPDWTPELTVRPLGEAEKNSKAFQARDEKGKMQSWVKVDETTPGAVKIKNPEPAPAKILDPKKTDYYVHPDGTITAEPKVRVPGYAKDLSGAYAADASGNFKAPADRANAEKKAGVGEKNPISHKADEKQTTKEWAANQGLTYNEATKQWVSKTAEKAKEAASKQVDPEAKPIVGDEATKQNAKEYNAAKEAQIKETAEKAKGEAGKPEDKATPEGVSEETKKAGKDYTALDRKSIKATAEKAKAAAEEQNSAAARKWAKDTGSYTPEELEIKLADPTNRARLFQEMRTDLDNLTNRPSTEPPTAPAGTPVEPTPKSPEGGTGAEAEARKPFQKGMSNEEAMKTYLMSEKSMTEAEALEHMKDPEKRKVTEEEMKAPQEDLEGDPEVEKAIKDKEALEAKQAKGIEEYKRVPTDEELTAWMKERKLDPALLDDTLAKMHMQFQWQIDQLHPLTEAVRVQVGDHYVIQSPATIKQALEAARARIEVARKIGREPEALDVVTTSRFATNSKGEVVELPDGAKRIEEQAKVADTEKRPRLDQIEKMAPKEALRWRLDQRRGGKPPTATVFPHTLTEGTKFTLDGKPVEVVEVDGDKITMTYRGEEITIDKRGIPQVDGSFKAWNRGDDTGRIAIDRGSLERKNPEPPTEPPTTPGGTPKAPEPKAPEGDKGGAVTPPAPTEPAPDFGSLLDSEPTKPTEPEAPKQEAPKQEATKTAEQPKLEQAEVTPAPKTEPAVTPAAAATEIKKQVKKEVLQMLDPRGAKETKEALLTRINEAIEAAPTKMDRSLSEVKEGTPEKITISIPGDGEFTVINTKENLQELYKRANAIGTKTGDQAGLKELKKKEEKPSLDTGETAEKLVKTYGSAEKAHSAMVKMREVELANREEGDSVTPAKERETENIISRLADKATRERVETKLQSTTVEEAQKVTDRDDQMKVIEAHITPVTDLTKIHNNGRRLALDGIYVVREGMERIYGITTHMPKVQQLGYKTLTKTDKSSKGPQHLIASAYAEIPDGYKQSGVLGKKPKKE